MAGDSVSTTLLLLCISLSSQSLPFLRWGWWLSCFLEWDFSLLLRVVCPLWKINSPDCYSSWGYFIFLLVVFLQFLAPNRHFTLKVDSDLSFQLNQPTRCSNFSSLLLVVWIGLRILMFVTVLPGPLNPEHWGWLTDWLAAWLTESLTDWLADWLPTRMLNRLCDIWYAYDSSSEGCCLLKCDAAYSGGYVWMFWGTVCLHLQVRRRKMEVLCCCDDMCASKWYHIPSLSDHFVMKC